MRYLLIYNGLNAWKLCILLCRALQKHAFYRKNVSFVHSENVQMGCLFAEKRGVKRISRCQNLHFSHVSQTYGLFWKFLLIFASKTTYRSETPHISTQNTIFSFDENDARSGILAGILDKLDHKFGSEERKIQENGHTKTLLCTVCKLQPDKGEDKTGGNTTAKENAQIVTSAESPRRCRESRNRPCCTSFPRGHSRPAPRLPLGWRGRSRCCRGCHRPLESCS